MMVVKTALYSEITARNRPSCYAPPVAWAAAEFTQLLIGDHGGIEPHHTGMIVVSDECSLGTIRELSRTAAAGTMSPLRFAGASPSIVAGLPVLQQGIRGPTVTLTMAPERASSAIVSMITQWLGDGEVVAVIAIAHYSQADRHHLFKGLIATSSGDEVTRQIQQLCKPLEHPCADERLSSRS